MSMAERFARLPTGAKLLLILTAFLLPIGLALAWMGEAGIREADRAMQGRAEDQSRAAAQAIESLIARNALALRVSTNGALSSGPAGACDRAVRSLTIAPGVAQSFELEDTNGKSICSAGTVGDTGSLPLVAPGSISVRIAPNLSAVAVRVGVIGGMATALIPADELRTAAVEAPGEIQSVTVHDDARELRIFASNAAQGQLKTSEWPIGDGKLSARIAAPYEKV